MCEIRKECKWQLCSALQGLWGRSCEKVICFWVARTWNDERSGQPRSHGTDKNVEEVQNLLHWYWRLNIRAMAVKLNLDKETWKRREFFPVIRFSTMTMLKLTRCSLQSSFWPKIDYWNVTPTLFHDLVLNDFWLFPKVKSALKGRRFQGTEDIQKNTTALRAIPQQKFQKCFQQRQYHWTKCTAAQAEYFKGDPSW